MNRTIFLDRDGVLNESLVRDGRPFSPTWLEARFLVGDRWCDMVTAIYAGCTSFILITDIA